MEKLLPQNIEAECGVLGSIIIDPEAITEVLDFLHPDDFYRDSHRTIYMAVIRLYEHHAPADFITLCDELERRSTLEEVGGASYIISLSNQVPTSGNIEYYARIIKRTAILRRLIHAAGRIAAVAYEESDAEEALSKAGQLISSIVQDEVPDGVVPINVIEADFYNWLDRIPTGGAIVGVPTGLSNLDALTGGLQKSDLIVLAARPGVGKTSAAMTIACNSALDYRRGVLIFSLEMSRDQLFQRFIAMKAKVNLKRLRTGQLTQDEMERVIREASLLGEAPILIDHTPALSIAAMRSRIRRTLAHHDIDLIIVDYLQKMTATDADGKRYRTEYQEVSEIAKGLKDIAREFNLPVLVPSQLSRAVEGYQDHIPSLAHLRASGAIEQEADIVIFIHRDDYYTGKESTRPGTADFIVAKHRNGETCEAGELVLGFEKTQTRFYDLGTTVVESDTSREVMTYAGGMDDEL